MPGPIDNKLTISFNERPTLSHNGEKIDLQKQAQTLTVTRKDGSTKQIQGFKTESGTIFELKKNTDHQKGMPWKIRVYGPPEKLAALDLKVRNGDVTKARFGDQRFDHINPFKPKEFAINGNDLAKADEFAKNFHLQRMGEEKAPLDIDREKKDEDAIKQEQRLEQPPEQLLKQPPEEPLKQPREQLPEQPPEQSQAKPLDQAQAKPVDQSQVKPEPARPALITKWEQAAAKMSSVQMIKQLPGVEIWSALMDGEITLQTYERALQEKFLPADESAHWLKEGRKLASEGRLPNPDTVSLDKQRARFVRDMVQRDLASNLNYRHVWGMLMDGKITERAYGMILRQQMRDKKIENGWPTSSRPKDAENKARTVDLTVLVNNRKLEFHQIRMYAEAPLGVLSDKHKSGDLSDVAYDSILQSQKRRGLITEAQFNASTTLKSI